MDESFCMHCISYVHPLASYQSDRLDLVSFIIFRTCDLPAYHFVGSSFLAHLSQNLMILCYYKQILVTVPPSELLNLLVNILSTAWYRIPR